MKRYSVVHVRERLADVLDEAEAGHPVFIERRGVRYVLKVEQPESKARRRKRQPRIETIDRSVENGQWQWTLSAKGLRFRSRREA
jgi:hypothetical protein